MADVFDSVSDVVGHLIDTLEPAGETYAFGGAVALAAWSEPRATSDVDVVLWVDETRLTLAIKLIASAGVTLRESAALQSATARGMFAGRMGHVRVDVFVPSIPFYEEASKRRVRTQMLGRDTWIHSAEVLAVFKMLFFRPKDLVDVERMLQVQGEAFDRTFVRAHLVDMLGADERIRTWDEICSRVSEPTHG